MKAAYINQPGPPGQIQYDDLPMPVIGKQDVMVKVIVVTVNGVDTYIRGGQFQTKMPFPFIIGRDMAGEVVEVGKEASLFLKLLKPIRSTSRRICLGKLCFHRNGKRELDLVSMS